ncbi:MAG: hypothetical protein HeimC3_37820 [Candidatus Heimdallarchaeota archaeon LC_3]|nr:MAG: hypothetical protein HeimC3_50570 [Candidatus Heimdallarchaeota archaeon LC_3]OLS21033.1 MAG: hypothetical protein HeimC3_37820 [Candidatus Heimdallarchaeota archaeon LC_3]
MELNQFFGDLNENKQTQNGFKIYQLFFFRIIKRRWYLPGTPEITVDELFDRINTNQTPLIIDTRDRKEYDGADGAYKTTGHIPNSSQYP